MEDGSHERRRKAAREAFEGRGVLGNEFAGILRKLEHLAKRPPIALEKYGACFGICETDVEIHQDAVRGPPALLVEDDRHRRVANDFARHDHISAFIGRDFESRAPDKLSPDGIRQPLLNAIRRRSICKRRNRNRLSIAAIQFLVREAIPTAKSRENKIERDEDSKLPHEAV